MNQSYDYCLNNNFYRVCYLNNEWCFVGHIVNEQFSHFGIFFTKKETAFDCMTRLACYIDTIMDQNIIDKCYNIGACVCNKGNDCILTKKMLNYEINFLQQKISEVMTYVNY
jgi:hypothetical protein